MVPERSGRSNTCGWVLRYEKGLSAQFDELVKVLGSPPELQAVSEKLADAGKSVPLKRDTCTGLQVSALDDESRSLLAHYYRHDFELFGYSREEWDAEVVSASD